MNFSTFSRIFHSHPLSCSLENPKIYSHWVFDFTPNHSSFNEDDLLFLAHSTEQSSLSLLTSHLSTHAMMLLNCLNVAQPESAKVALFCRQPQYSTHSLSSHQPPISLHQNAHTYTQIHKYSSFLPQSFCCSFCRIISFRA